MNKKELKQNYKLSVRPIGVFQICNLTNEKVFVGSSENLDGIFIGHKFQLNAGIHPNKQFQADWNELGEDKFAFEILEKLEQRNGIDIKKELEFLEDLWLEKLQPFGKKGYNERKKTREERLQMIADKRNKLNIDFVEDFLNESRPNLASDVAIGAVIDERNEC